ncbi:MAG: carotenoid biosynthesis protein [Crocinitomicaceae bacterium]
MKPYWYGPFAIGIILILHIVGLYEILIGKNTDLMASSSWIILISSALCFAPEFKTISKNWVPYLSVYLIGFCAEMIGVNTGYLFGEYTYSDSLGIKILETPLIIGILWLSLSIGIQSFFKHFNLSKSANILLGSLFMLLFDALLEPVAIAYNLWSWQEGTPPLFNYICWFVLAFLMQWLLWNTTKKKSLFKYLFFINLFFFVGLYLGI